MSFQNLLTLSQGYFITNFHSSLLDNFLICFQENPSELLKWPKRAFINEVAKLKSVRLYKVLSGLSAPRLTDNFIRLRDLEGCYHLRNCDTDLKLPKPKTNFLKRCFNYSASSLCNSLSTEAKKAASVSHFKRCIASLSLNLQHIINVHA